MNPFYYQLIAPTIFLIVIVFIIIRRVLQPKSNKPKEPAQQVEFTRATTEDIELINALATKIWRKHYIPIIGSETVEYMLELMYSPATIQKDMTSGLEYYIIEYSGKPIGYFGVKNESEKLFLSRIYIKEAFRGKHIGAKTIKFISSLGRSRSQKAIYLSVAKKNTNSIEFYKGCGFEITDEMVKDIGEGHNMDDYIMTKDLTS